MIYYILALVSAAQIKIDETSSASFLIRSIDYMHQAFGDIPEIYPYDNIDVTLYYNYTSNCFTDYLDLGSLLLNSGENNYQDFFDSYQDTIDIFLNIDTNNNDYLALIKKSMLDIYNTSVYDENKEFSFMAYTAYKNLYSKYFDLVLKYETSVSLPVPTFSEKKSPKAPSLYVDFEFLDEITGNTEKNIDDQTVGYLVPGTGVLIDGIIVNGTFSNQSRLTKRAPGDRILGYSITTARRMLASESLRSSITPRLTRDFSLIPNRERTLPRFAAILPGAAIEIAVKTAAQAAGFPIPDFIEKGIIGAIATQAFSEIVIKPRGLINIKDKFDIIINGEYNALSKDPLLIPYKDYGLSQTKEEYNDAVEMVNIYNTVSGNNMEMPKPEELTETVGIMDLIDDDNFGNFLINYDGPDALSIARKFRKNNARQRRYQQAKPYGTCALKDDKIPDPKTSDREVAYHQKAFTSSGAVDTAITELVVTVTGGSEIIEGTFDNNADAFNFIVNEVESGSLDKKTYEKCVKQFGKIISHLEIKYSNPEKTVDPDDAKLIESIEKARFRNQISRKFQQRLQRRQLSKRPTNNNKQRSIRITGKPGWK